MRARIAVIVVLGVLTYWNGLSTPFLLDDGTAILTNRSIESLVWPGPLITPSDTPVARRPLINLSFAINYALGGRDVRGYHATNLLIHILAALTLFGIVRRTLRLPAFETTPEEGRSVALVCALVWLVHPLNSEVIQYVTQRSEGMLGLFYLLTVYCAIRSAGIPVALGNGHGTARKPHKHAGSAGLAGSRQRLRWQAAAVACSAAGMLCKESMVTAPLMVVLYDRALLYDSWKSLAAQRARLYGGLAASWVVLALAIQSASRTSAGLSTVRASWDYLLNQAQLISRYLYLSLWPRDLVVDYGRTRPIPLADVWIPAVLLTAAVIFIAIGVMQRRRSAVAGAWFFITLAPTSSIVPIATEVGAERRMYLPLAALVVLVVFAAYRLAKRFDVRATSLRVASALLLVLLALGTVSRSREYADPVRFAELMVERWPSGRGHVHLGTLYSERGRHQDAIREFRKGAEVYPPGHYTLGVDLIAQQQVDEGLAHLRTFTALAPKHSAVVGARDLIGRVLIDRGDLAGASRQFQLLLTEAPGNVRAMVLLAEVRLRQERVEEGIALFEGALRRDGAVARDSAFVRRFGAVLASKNRLDAAARVFAQGAAANPNDPQLQALWGRALAAQGLYAAAAQRFRHAQALAPHDPELSELVAAIDRRLGVTQR